MVTLHERPPGSRHLPSARAGRGSKNVQEGDPVPKTVSLVTDCSLPPEVFLEVWEQTLSLASGRTC